MKPKLVTPSEWKMSLQTSSFWTMFLPAAGLILAIAFYAYSTQVKLVFDRIAAQEKLAVGLGTGAIDRGLEDVAHDLLHLSRSTSMQAALADPTLENLEKLSKDFSSMAISTQSYQQIRWIDADGKERVRVDWVQGAPKVVSAADLQDKKGRYYFTETMAKPEGEIYVSPFDLNIENGKLEQPHRPTLRFATRVFDAKQQPQGILLINYEGRKLLDAFLQSAASLSANAVLLNADGFWLRSPQVEDEWGFMLQRTETFGSRFPSVWPRVRSQESAQFEDDAGLWTLQTVYPEELGRHLKESKQKNFWKVLSRVPHETLVAERVLAARPVLFFMFFSLCFVLFASLALTRHRLRRQAFDRAQRNLATMHDSAGRLAKVGGWSIDVTTQVLNWTEETFRIHGLDPKQPIDIVPAIEFYAPEARPQITAAVQACIENGTPFDLELPFITAQGKSLWVQAQGQAEQVAGKVVRIYGALQDISERKKVQLGLVEQQVELERLVQERTADLSEALLAARLADEGKDAFLANVSHELRTPLNVVIGLSDLALRMTTEQKPREYLEKISNAGRSLARIINDLLDISKIAAGRMDLETVTFSPQHLLEHVKGMFESAAQDKGIALKLEFAKALEPALQGDTLRIEQILLNLLSNAIKFTDKGEIRLSLSTQALDKNQVRLDIVVKDSGIGMSKDELQRLFQPFTQADVSITRRFGGSGLGLALCKRLVELMGGEINMYSQQGVGSTVAFKLILLRGEVSALQANFSEQAPKSLSGRVLVVDDQALNREIACELLRAIDIEAIEAADGTEAIELLERHPPDYFSAVLMDLQMPVMDGLTATRCIRSMDGFAKLPVIALTAHTMEHEKQKARDAGMSDHIGKPFDRASFYLVVGRWLSKA